MAKPPLGLLPSSAAPPDAPLVIPTVAWLAEAPRGSGEAILLAPTPPPPTASGDVEIVPYLFPEICYRPALAFPADQAEAATALRISDACYLYLKAEPATLRGRGARRAQPVAAVGRQQLALPARDDAGGDSPQLRVDGAARDGDRRRTDPGGPRD